MNAQATVATSVGFKLGWETDEGMRLSRFPYVSEHAAETAAPTLNLGRFIHGAAPYTHVLGFAGDQLVSARTLEEAA